VSKLTYLLTLVTAPLFFGVLCIN